MRVFVIFLILCTVAYFVPLILFDGVTAATLWPVWQKHPGLATYEGVVVIICSIGLNRALLPKKA